MEKVAMAVPAGMAEREEIQPASVMQAVMEVMVVEEETAVTVELEAMYPSFIKQLEM